jgi:hypothetical protein
MKDSPERNEVEAHDQSDPRRHKVLMPQTEAQQYSESDQHALCDSNTSEPNRDLVRFSALTLIAVFEFSTFEPDSVS